MSDPISYRVHFSGTARPFDPVDVHDVADLAAPQLADAVRAHVAPRWPGAQLVITINRARATGRVLAGQPPAGRRIAAFTLAPWVDGAPPPAPPRDPRADVDATAEQLASRS